MKTRLRAVMSSGRMLTLTTVLSVALSGCSNDTESLNGFDGSPAANEEVPLQIAGGSISADVQTRATTITNGSIGIFRAANNDYSALYNVQYSYNDGWKVSSSEKTIYLSQKNATLYAYYPYNSFSFTANSTKATLTAQKFVDAMDMCYATSGGSNVCNKTPNATFAMNRAYSRIQLFIKRHAKNYVGTGYVSNINFKNGSTFYYGCTLDIATGTYGGDATDGGWSYAFNTTITAGATKSADLLVPPQPVGNGLTITLTLDGVNRSVTVPAGKFTSNSLAAGKIYKITLEISAAQINIDGSVTGDDYGTQGNTDYELNIYAVTVDDYGSQENADFETNAK